MCKNDIVRLTKSLHTNVISASEHDQLLFYCISGFCLQTHTLYKLYFKSVFTMHLHVLLPRYLSLAIKSFDGLMYCDEFGASLIQDINCCHMQNKLFHSLGAKLHKL